MEGKLYEHVGIEVGHMDDGTHNTQPQHVVGILLPTGIGEECEAVYMTLPCAKALLIDLRDAIAAAEQY